MKKSNRKIFKYSGIILAVLLIASMMVFSTLADSPDMTPQNNGFATVDPESSEEESSQAAEEPTPVVPETGEEETEGEESSEIEENSVEPPAQTPGPVPNGDEGTAITDIAEIEKAITSYNLLTGNDVQESEFFTGQAIYFSHIISLAAGDGVGGYIAAGTLSYVVEIDEGATYVGTDVSTSWSVLEEKAGVNGVPAGKFRITMTNKENIAMGRTFETGLTIRPAPNYITKPGLTINAEAYIMFGPADGAKTKVDFTKTPEPAKIINKLALKTKVREVPIAMTNKLTLKYIHTNMVEYENANLTTYTEPYMLESGTEIINLTGLHKRFSLSISSIWNQADIQTGMYYPGKISFKQPFVVPEINGKPILLMTKANIKVGGAIIPDENIVVNETFVQGGITYLKSFDIVFTSEMLTSANQDGSTKYTTPSIVKEVVFGTTERYTIPSTTIVLQGRDSYRANMEAYNFKSDSTESAILKLGAHGGLVHEVSAYVAPETVVKQNEATNLTNKFNFLKDVFNEAHYKNTSSTYNHQANFSYLNGGSSWSRVVTSGDMFRMNYYNHFNRQNLFMDEIKLNINQDTSGYIPRNIYVASSNSTAFRAVPSKIQITLSDGTEYVISESATEPKYTFDRNYPLVESYVDPHGRTSVVTKFLEETATTVDGKTTYTYLEASAAPSVYDVKSIQVFYLNAANSTGVHNYVNYGVFVDYQALYNENTSATLKNTSEVSYLYYLYGDKTAGLDTKKEVTSIPKTVSISYNRETFAAQSRNKIYKNLSAGGTAAPAMGDTLEFALTIKNEGGNGTWGVPLIEDFYTDSVLEPIAATGGGLIGDLKLSTTVSGLGIASASIETSTREGTLGKKYLKIILSGNVAEGESFTLTYKTSVIAATDGKQIRNTYDVYAKRVSGPGEPGTGTGPGGWHPGHGGGGSGTVGDDYIWVQGGYWGSIGSGSSSFKFTSTITSTAVTSENVAVAVNNMGDGDVLTTKTTYYLDRQMTSPAEIMSASLIIQNIVNGTSNTAVVPREAIIEYGTKKITVPATDFIKTVAADGTIQYLVKFPADFMFNKNIENGTLNVIFISDIDTTKLAPGTVTNDINFTPKTAIYTKAAMSVARAYGSYTQLYAPTTNGLNDNPNIAYGSNYTQTHSILINDVKAYIYPLIANNSYYFSNQAGEALTVPVVLENHGNGSLKIKSFTLKIPFFLEFTSIDSLINPQLFEGGLDVSDLTYKVNERTGVANGKTFTYQYINIYRADGELLVMKANPRSNAGYVANAQIKVKLAHKSFEEQEAYYYDQFTDGDTMTSGFSSGEAVNFNTVLYLENSQTLILDAQNNGSKAKSSYLANSTYNRWTPSVALNFYDYNGDGQTGARVVYATQAFPIYTNYVAPKVTVSPKTILFNGTNETWGPYSDDNADFITPDALLGLEISAGINAAYYSTYSPYVITVRIPDNMTFAGYKGGAIGNINSGQPTEILSFQEITKNGSKYLTWVMKATSSKYLSNFSIRLQTDPNYYGKVFIETYVTPDFKNPFNKAQVDTGFGTRTNANPILDLGWYSATNIDDGTAILGNYKPHIDMGAVLSVKAETTVKVYGQISVTSTLQQKVGAVVTSSDKGARLTPLRDSTTPVEYLAEVNNYGAHPVANLVIINRLPQPNDSYVVRSGASRESTIAVGIDAAVDVTLRNADTNAELKTLVLGTDYTIEFAKISNPRYGFTKADWQPGAGSGIWTHPSADGANAFRIVLKIKLAKNERISFAYNTKFPADPAINATAYNSFGYSGLAGPTSTVEFKTEAYKQGVKYQSDLIIKVIKTVITGADTLKDTSFTIEAYATRGNTGADAELIKTVTVTPTKLDTTTWVGEITIDGLFASDLELESFVAIETGVDKYKTTTSTKVYKDHFDNNIVELSVVNIPPMTVKYDANGATGAVEIDDTLYYMGIDKNMPILVDQGDLEYEGAEFLGWSTSKTDPTIHEPSVTVDITEDTTFYARWNLKKVSIVYTNKEATAGAAPSGQTVTYGTPVNIKDKGTLVRDKYEFKGWYDADNDKSYAPGDEFAVTTTMTDDQIFTLDPVWEKIQYSLTYENNYPTGEVTGAGSIETANYGLDDMINIEEAKGKGITVTDFSFMGWTVKGTNTPVYANASDAVAGANAQIKMTGPIILVANWKEITQNISYKAVVPSGEAVTGIVPAAKDYRQNTVANIESGKQLKITSGKYMFAGWKLTGDSTGKIYASVADALSGAITTIKADTDIIFEATWRNSNYAVSYEANAPAGYTPTGTFPSAKSYIEGTDVPVESVGTGQVPNHIFKGWKIKGDATNTIYASASDNILGLRNIPSITKAVTFQAVWAAEEYKVTYLKGNAAVTGTPPTELTGLAPKTSVTVAAATGLTYTNYQFAGWVITSGNVEGVAQTVYQANDTFKLLSDIVLEAKWIGEEKIVSYHDYLSGFADTRPGFVSKKQITQTYIFGSTLNAELAPNAMNTLSFMGWGTVDQVNIGASLANVKYQAGDTLPSDGTVTNLYAYWRAKVSTTITVTYDLNGGTLAGYPKTANGAGPSFSTIMADAKGVRPPRGSGAFLKYWTEDPTGSGEHLMIDTAYNFTKDTTLYAQYARPARTININYGPNLLAANPTKTSISQGQTRMSIKVILAICSDPTLSVSGYRLLNETTGEIVILKNDGTGTNTFTATLTNPISDNCTYIIEAIWSTEGDTGLKQSRR